MGERRSIALASSPACTVSSASWGTLPVASMCTWYVPPGSLSMRQLPSAPVVAVCSAPAASRTVMVAPAMGRSPASVTTRPESTEGGGVKR